MNRIPTPSRTLSTRTVLAVALGASLTALATPFDAWAGGAQTKPVIARHRESLAPASPRAQADEAFRLQRYAEAYGRYAALADEGDATSAGMALMLVANGAALFGSPWSASPGQLKRWSALAAREAQQRAPALSEHERGE